MNFLIEFVTNLNLDKRRIRVNSITEGSTIFDFNILADTSEELSGFKNILSTATYEYTVL